MLLPEAIVRPRPRTGRTDKLEHATAAGTPVTVISFDRADPRVPVSVTVARGFPHGDESFGAMIHRANPVLAINGAYFSTTDLAPIGDIVANGRLLYQGLLGTCAARSGVVVTTQSPVTFQHWAEMMLALHARDAMNLDGAASLALYYRGKMYIAPSRKLPHMLTVSIGE